MSLFLLGDTNQLDNSLKEKMGLEINNHGNKIAYISSSPQDDKRKFYEITKADYANIHAPAALEYFDLSDAFDDEKLRHLLDFDVIHLSGGNTYSFLEFLRKRRIQELLEKHVARNGLIIGVSAGAIALTPDIGTSQFCGDINIPRLSDLTGMSFVDFCFLPHLGVQFQNTSENLVKAQVYATQISRELYIATDPSGIFIDITGQPTLYGDLQKMVP